MPASYQAPSRKDAGKPKTQSQNTTSNQATHVATVSQLIDAKGGDIFSVKPGDTIALAVDVLKEKRIGAVLVTDDSGKMVGILSERDIVRKLADTPGKTLPQLVGDVMTSEVQACNSSDPLMTVLQRMTQGRFRHMPVVDGEILIGILTIGDVVNFRLNELEHEALQLKQLIVG